ncbi:MULTISPECIES: outer membrane protein assembly factor BamB family protein [Streptomycetaceae]|nr:MULTISPECIES: PQQ-binding-like beta-propeller repeat protein [Streptomycetaceae]MYS59145.1 PQQ-binding-like beta-propeller repeat protein [Streptomyces sp. SID5468]
MSQPPPPPGGPVRPGPYGGPPPPVPPGASVPVPPPGPYGAAPYGQPYPAQQPYPVPPVPPVPPGPGGGGRRGRLAGVVAGVVAAVLVVAGGVWFWAAGDHGHHDRPLPAPVAGHQADGRVRWTVPAPAIPKGRLVAPVPGLWFDGDEVVKQSPDAVTGYDLASGAQRWTVAAPQGATCVSATDLVAGRVAVQYGAHCENVMVVDVRAGRMLWHKPLPAPTDSLLPATDAFQSTDMALSGDTVAVTWGPSVATMAYQASTGRELWHSSEGSPCHDKGFGGGAQLIEVYQCSGSGNPNHVSLVDPASGKPVWTWDAPAGTDVRNVVSTKPVVIGLSANTGLTDLWDIDGGRLGGRISLGRGSGDLGRYAISCPAGGRMTPCRNVAVDGGTLYLATVDHPGHAKGTRTNEIAAFDLATGDGRWLSSSQERPMDLVTVEGSSVIAYETPPADRGGTVLKIDTGTGKATPYTTFAAATASREQPFQGSWDLAEGWHDDTLVLALAGIAAGARLPYLMATLR